MKKWQGKLLASMVVLGLLISSVGCGTTSQTEESTPEDTGSTTPAEIQERVIKLGFALQMDHPQGLGAKKFAELMDEKSGGKIQVRLYSDSQLGDDNQQTSALVSGTQEAVIQASSALTGRVKEFGILDFPFLFNSEQEAFAILDGPVGKALFDKLPEQGLIGLGYFDNGFRNVTNSKHPINTADDFKGLKIRTMQSPVYLDTFKAIGANPTPMAFAELYTALESKTVDAQENPFSIINSSKFYEVQHYLSITRHTYNTFVFAMSKKFWDQLTPTEQEMIQEAATEATQYERQINVELNNQILGELEGLMEVNEISPEEMAKIRELVKPVAEKYSEEYGADLVNQMYSELETIRK